MIGRKNPVELRRMGGGKWCAVRAKGGLVLGSWPLDAESSRAVTDLWTVYAWVDHLTAESGLNVREIEEALSVPRFEGWKN